MNYQWILSALLLVAVLIGVSKAIFKPMLKNTLRLAAVVIAFLITFILQLCGVFQNIVGTILEAVNISSLLGDLPIETGILVALAGSFVTPIFFGIVFLLLLLVIRIVVHFVLPDKKRTAAKDSVTPEKATEEKAEAAKPTEAATPAEATETAETAEAIASAEAPEGTDGANTEAASETAQAAPAAETVTDAVEETPKKKKGKKVFFCGECAWKGAVSAATGVVSGVLILGVLLMPMFYLMSVVGTVTHATDGSDADDSQAYKVVEVVDTYVVAPYEDSFVIGLYDTIAISDLMNYTAKVGGKIVLENEEVIYADDVLKNILSHGVSAAAQAISLKSACPTIREDLDALLADPVVSDILSDYLKDFLQSYDPGETEENDLVQGLLNNLIDHYKEADEETFKKDLLVLGNIVAVLAEDGIIADVLTDNLVVEDLLKDGEKLGDIAATISALSAFGATLQDTFTMGVEILGETLQIPTDDSDAYEIFMDELLLKMQKDSNTKFDLNTIRNYVYTCATKGLKVSSNNGVKGHSQFIAYATHWEKVQAAFAHASEDTSYGYFTMEINGEWYIYDKNNKKIFVYSEENAADYADKRSPVAGIINALTLKSTTKQLTRDNVYTILNAYVSSAKDEVSVELANRILAKENFVSKAVTVEKLLAAMNFEDWTDEEKANDSRICVNIMLELLGLMDHLGSLDTSDGLESAAELLDEFVLLGETMDNMKKTSCINALPSLLIEAIIKHEAFSAYIKPSIAFQLNNIVDNNNKTYADCMTQIASVLRWAIDSLGGGII